MASAMVSKRLLGIPNLIIVSVLAIQTANFNWRSKPAVLEIRRI